MTRTGSRTPWARTCVASPSPTLTPMTPGSGSAQLQTTILRAHQCHCSSRARIPLLHWLPLMTLSGKWRSILHRRVVWTSLSLTWWLTPHTRSQWTCLAGPRWTSSRWSARPQARRLQTSSGTLTSAATGLTGACTRRGGFRRMISTSMLSLLLADSLLIEICE